MFPSEKTHEVNFRKLLPAIYYSWPFDIEIPFKCSPLHKIPYSLIGRRPSFPCYLAPINVSEWCIDFSTKDWTQVSKVFKWNNKNRLQKQFNKV